MPTNIHFENKEHDVRERRAHEERGEEEADRQEERPPKSQSNIEQINLFNILDEERLRGAEEMRRADRGTIETAGEECLERARAT